MTNEQMAADFVAHGMRWEPGMVAYTYEDDDPVLLASTVDGECWAYDPCNHEGWPCTPMLPDLSHAGTVGLIMAQLAHLEGCSLVLAIDGEPVTASVDRLARWVRENSAGNPAAADAWVKAVFLTNEPGCMEALRAVALHTYPPKSEKESTHGKESGISKRLCTPTPPKVKGSRTGGGGG